MRSLSQRTAQISFAAHAKRVKQTKQAKQKKQAEHLITIRQGSKESTQDYLTPFTIETTNVEHLSDEIARVALASGLWGDTKFK